MILKINLEKINRNFLCWFKHIYVGSEIKFEPSFELPVFINSKDMLYSGFDIDYEELYQYDFDQPLYIHEISLVGNHLLIKTYNEKLKTSKTTSLQKLVNDKFYRYVIGYTDEFNDRLIEALINIKQAFTYKSIDYFSIIEKENEKNYYRVLKELEENKFVNDRLTDEYISYEPETIDDLDKHFTISDNNVLFYSVFAINRLTKKANCRKRAANDLWIIKSTDIKNQSIKKCALLKGFLDMIKINPTISSPLITLCLTNRERSDVRMAFLNKTESKYYQIAELCKLKNDDVVEELNRRMFG